MESDMRAACLLLLLHCVNVEAHERPDVYAELDEWLSARSARYRGMADAVRKRQPYRIAPTTEFPLGNVKDGDGELVIELNPGIPKERLATILIWEMANAFQRERFAEVTRRAVVGEIVNEREYGIRMELVEYDSHQLHRDVLEELSRAGVTISGDFLSFLDPKARSLSDYRIPTAPDYIEAQAKSGHTKHYEQWYHRVMETATEQTNHR
jgi:hypothetical protein